MTDLILVALPDKTLTQPKMYFPLSLLYLAAVVKKAGFNVEILDCRDGEKPIPPARFYGFSCVTPQIEDAKRMAKKITVGQTIVGGAHPSVMPEDCIHDFNYVVVGEGEKEITRIMEGIYANGIIRADRIERLDDVPYPAWDMTAEPFSTSLFPGERYGQGELGATLIASRGCPFSCHFCANIHRAPVTYRSAENILGELEALKTRGVNYFRFEDDCFTLLPDFEQLCRKIRALNIRYKCHSRSDLMTPEKAFYMKLSGCEECGLGVESADDRVLKIMNKRESASEHKVAIKVLKEAGLRVKTYWVMGMPGETDETLELNKAFIRETKPDKWTVSTFTPYPGSAVYKNPDKFNIKITNPDWRNWWNFCEDGYNHVLNGQTQKQMWARYKEFYGWLKKESWR